MGKQGHRGNMHLDLEIVRFVVSLHSYGNEIQGLGPAAQKALYPVSMRLTLEV